MSVPATPASNLPSSTSFGTDEEAAAALLAMYSPSGDVPSLSQIADEVDGGSGLRLTHPFSQIRKGNWTTHKSCPEAIIDAMPVGDRPFNMIYLGHRLGATCWRGKPGDGTPPAYGFALPHGRLDSRAVDMQRRTLYVGSLVQYKKLPEAVLGELGKLTPEVHVFGWTPKTGFVILVVSGYSSSQFTIDNMKGNIETNCPQTALKFEIDPHITENRKRPIDDPRRKWTDYAIKATSTPTDPRTQDLMGSWTQYFQTNIKEVASQCTTFLKAADFQGLPLADVDARLKDYERHVR